MLRESVILPVKNVKKKQKGARKLKSKNKIDERYEVETK